MLEKILQKECCGCGACLNKCPKGAIKMQESQEGFLYPYINQTECVDCGLCQKICPTITYKKRRGLPISCYAAIANDELRKRSSSGGVFPVLALHILSKNGRVVGAAFKEDGKVEHIMIANPEDLTKLQGSKYLQSNSTLIMPTIKQVLEEGIDILFTGTPCQIAGIKAYLGKDYSNLYLLDIICHGVPSPKVFQKYLQENFKDGDFIETNFRDKSYGWSPNLTITTTITTTTTTSFAAQNDDFTKAFLNNLCLRKTCGECKFNSLPRESDLTCGDFWGVNRVNKNWNDELGVSEILVNTHKGEILLNEVKSKFKILENVKLEDLTPSNPNIYISSVHHGNRENFFKDLNSGKDLHKSVEDNLKYDYLCLNFWTSLNYGAVLTAYALQNILDSLGYTSAHIDYRYPHVLEKFNNSFTDKFARKYLHHTRQYKNYNDMRSLNNLVTRGFLVGSDQVFRDDSIPNTFGLYFLAFADADKQRIAISASFGKNSFNLKNADKFFKGFDAISVREKLGLNILKENYYNKGEHILDPVFLVDINAFKNLTKEIVIPEDLIVGYILDENEEINKFTAQYGDKYLNIAKLDVSVEEFVAYFEKASAVITDSFHGTCFAILFNKPYKIFVNVIRGNTRFESILETLSLPEDTLNSNTDWVQVNKIIEKEKEKGIRWIKTNLEKQHISNKKYCKKLHKLATKRKHSHSFWWHLIHLKF